MRNSIRARGPGSRPGKAAEKAKKVKFRCETCQQGESYRPCLGDVVYDNYMQNPHLMRTGWAHRVQEEGRFDIAAKDGSIHTLVLCPMPQAPSQDPEAASFRETALQQWKSRTLGPARVLNSLEKLPGVEFCLDDQTHWFDESKERVILSPGDVLEVMDTEGVIYSVPTQKELAKHKSDAFNQWKRHLNQVSIKLMGESVAKRFTLEVDPLWSRYDPECNPQPVGSQTPLDEFDWDYDAEMSQDLEDHLAGINHNT